MSLGRTSTQSTQGSAASDSRRVKKTASGRILSSSRGSVIGLDDGSISLCRLRWSRLLETRCFNMTMGFVILANMVLMAYEAETRSACGSTCAGSVLVYLSYLDFIFLAIYTAESVLRLYVYRCTFFHSGWNVMDFMIVLVGYVDVVMLFLKEHIEGGSSSNMAMIRMLRTLRILRSVRLFEEIPELYLMLRSFFGAMRAMCWGIVMVILLLFMFAILTVQLIHPVAAGLHEQDEFCTEWFGKIWFCMLLFFQGLVAGDSWGRCAMPVIKEAWWSIFIFGGAFTCVTIGFMNLILATIVEKAAESKAANDEEKMMTLKANRLKATESLWATLRDLDADDSGTISLEELMEGYESNMEMQNMFFKLDMKRDDVAAVFDLMDTERENSLGYESLIDNLRLVEDGDHRKSILMLRLQSAETVRTNKKISERLSELIRHFIDSGDGLKSPRSPGLPPARNIDGRKGGIPFGIGADSDDPPEGKSASLLCVPPQVGPPTGIGVGGKCHEEGSGNLNVNVNVNVSAGNLRPENGDMIDVTRQVPGAYAHVDSAWLEAAAKQNISTPTKAIPTGKWPVPCTPRENFDASDRAGKMLPIANADAAGYSNDPISDDLGMESKVGSIQPTGSKHLLAFAPRVRGGGATRMHVNSLRDGSNLRIQGTA